MRNHILLVAAVLLSFPQAAHAAKPAKKAPAKAAQKTAAAPEEKSAKSQILNDAWYTMQSGSSPWGYFHEIIEKRDGRYLYRYEMTKREKAVLFQESLGAVAEENLTPVAFNLTKAGENATEIVNGTYAREKTSGVMNIDVKGARVAALKRHIADGTILEVFFPVWLVQRWDKLKPGYRGRVRVFTEDPARDEFIARPVSFTVKGPDAKDGCTEINIEMENTRSLWCMTSAGSLVRMDINGRQAQIRRASSEQEAKAFLDASGGAGKTVRNVSE
ncbi:MAG: hypothetical protein HYW49_11055 [Deltaproteobacteria bacterium]|nr:hypothetical protein [Deltaproteobacteria bacterium]